jgi:hypothetical protein
MKLFFKLAFFLFGCLIIFIMAIASNSDWFDKYEHCFPSAVRYGDLYFQTNTPGYAAESKRVKPILTSKNSKTTLTIVGDSYTQGFDSLDFSAGTYHFIHWNSLQDTLPALDSNKRNIIIIETSERFIRQRFVNHNHLYVEKESNAKARKTTTEIKLLAENNLQYLLTYFDWQLPFKEQKSSIYLHWFDRFSPLVTKPDSSGRLYLKETIDPELLSSSFNSVSDAEIQNLVKDLNTINNELYRIGFDEVYMSFIPNPASIYKTNNPIPYNRLIERIQKNPSVLFKTIDVLAVFQKQKTAVFKFNDSHWNELGKMIWILKVNQYIDTSH